MSLSVGDGGGAFVILEAKDESGSEIMETEFKTYSNLWEPGDGLARGAGQLGKHGAVADELSRGDGVGGIGARREPARRQPAGQLGDRQDHARVGLPGGEALGGEAGRDVGGDLLPGEEGRAGVGEVESNVMDGTGKVQLTGKLGDTQ